MSVAGHYAFAALTNLGIASYCAWQSVTDGAAWLVVAVFAAFAAGTSAANAVHESKDPS